MPPTFSMDMMESAKIFTATTGEWSPKSSVMTWAHKSKPVVCSLTLAIYEKGSLKENTLQALRDEDFHLIEIDFRPTAENFARYIFMTLKDQGLPMHRIEVYETPTNCAIYEE